MNPKPYIIQWNLNGIKTRSKLGELQRLLKDYEPMCLCIQHIGEYDTNIKNYQLVSQSIKTQNELGTAIYIHNKTTFENLPVQSSYMQQSATVIHLENNKKLTICNMYNQPLYNYNVSNIKDIINNLPQPILLVGDFNAHSPLWDDNCREADTPGKKIEDLIDECNMHCLNEEDSPTHISRINGAIVSIDLAICSNRIANQFEWSALEDDYTSDHFPILITHLQHQTQTRTERYKTDKADWIKFKAQLSTNIPVFNENMNIEESYKIIKEAIINAANESIPKTSNSTRKREVPWWNKEMQELVNKKHKVSNMMIHTRKKLDKILNSVNHTQEQMRKIIQLSTELKVIRKSLNIRTN